MTHFDVAIVGAGHAGAQAAIQLRQLGFAGSVGVIGAEAELPYERPPLSKEYLAGEKPFERMLIRPPVFWAERAVEIVTGTRIVAVDPLEHRLAAENGRGFSYGTLIWAAGGTPRRLRCEGGDLAGVHVVRCRAGVDAILAELPEAKRVAVVGGGYVGLETAAGLRGLGKEVVLLEAGADGANGVDVDAFCRTSLADVYAIGDCAGHDNLFAGGIRLRLESVQNAHDMAATAARAIVGQPEPYAALPWFWSNQYDLKLQTVGLSVGHDETVVRGDPAERSFSVLYLLAGRVIALDCVNSTRDYVQGRKLILERTAVAPERLADASVPLKEMT